MFRHQFINHVANGLGVLRSRTYRSIARMKPTATERFWQQPQQQQIQLRLQRRFLATKPTIQIKTNQQKEKIAYFVDSKVDYLTGAEFKTDLVQLCKVFAFWFIQTSVWLSVIRNYIVDIVPCNGPSMLPTVAQQDLFLATPLTLWVRKMMGDKTLGLEKGDVILSLYARTLLRVLRARRALKRHPSRSKGHQTARGSALARKRALFRYLLRVPDTWFYDDVIQQ